MSVPKAAMHENDLMASLKYNIRTPRHGFLVKSVSEAFSKDHLSHHHLRLCIFGTNERHPLTPVGFAHRVHANAFSTKEQF
jgi:hypothetical protein